MKCSRVALSLLLSALGGAVIALGATVDQGQGNQYVYGCPEAQDSYGYSEAQDRYNYSEAQNSYGYSEAQNSYGDRYADIETGRKNVYGGSDSYDSQSDDSRSDYQYGGPEGYGYECRNEPGFPPYGCVPTIQDAVEVVDSTENDNTTSDAYTYEYDDYQTYYGNEYRYANPTAGQDKDAAASQATGLSENAGAETTDSANASNTEAEKSSTGLNGSSADDEQYDYGYYYSQQAGQTAVSSESAEDAQTAVDVDESVEDASDDAEDTDEAEDAEDADDAEETQDGVYWYDDDSSEGDTHQDDASESEPSETSASETNASDVSSSVSNNSETYAYGSDSYPSDSYANDSYRSDAYRNDSYGNDANGSGYGYKPGWEHDYGYRYGSPNPYEDYNAAQNTETATDASDSADTSSNDSDQDPETDAVSGPAIDADMETDAVSGADADDETDGETGVESGVEVDADHEEEAGETTDADAPVETETDADAKTGADASSDTSYQYDAYESKYGYDYEDAYAAHGQGECEYYQGHSEAYPAQSDRDAEVTSSTPYGTQYNGQSDTDADHAKQYEYQYDYSYAAEKYGYAQHGYGQSDAQSDSASSYQPETYAGKNAYSYQPETYGGDSASSYQPETYDGKNVSSYQPETYGGDSAYSYQSETYVGENSAVRGPSLSDWLPTELLTVADQDFLKSLELLAEEPQDVRRAELANYLGSIGANSFEFTVRFEETTGVDVLSFVEDLPATAAMLATFRLIEQGAVSTEQGVELLRQALNGLPAEWIEDVREITRDAYASHLDVVQASHGERSQQSLADSAVLTAVTACVRSSVDSWKGLWYCMADRLTPPNWSTSSLKFVALIGQVGIADSTAR